MAPILRRQLRNCERQTSDTSVPLLKLLRNAEMSTRVYTTPTKPAGPRSIRSGICGSRCLCGSAWAYPTTSGHAAGPASPGDALSVQAEAGSGFAITEEVMASQELLRNANLRSAWDIPSKTAALQLQRDRTGQHLPAKASYITVNPKSGSLHKHQKLVRAAI